MNTNTAQLKAFLHKLIVETEDEQILSKVDTFFTTLKGENIDWWETISEKEKDSIESGLQQLESGQRIPDNLVREKVERLLGSK